MRSRWNTMRRWTARKGIKAQGMTFSETANVAASYRQQKHTEARFRIYNEGRAVSMNPDARARARAGGQSRWIEQSRVASLRQRWGTQQLRKSVYFRGSSNTGKDLQFNEDIENPFLERWFTETKVFPNGRNHSYILMRDHHLARSVGYVADGVFPLTLCFAYQPYEWSFPFAKWAIPTSGRKPPIDCVHSALQTGTPHFSVDVS